MFLEVVSSTIYCVYCRYEYASSSGRRNHAEHVDGADANVKLKKCHEDAHSHIIRHRDSVSVEM